MCNEYMEWSDEILAAGIAEFTHAWTADNASTADPLTTMREWQKKIEDAGKDPFTAYVTWHDVFYADPPSMRTPVIGPETRSEDEIAEGERALIAHLKANTAYAVEINQLFEDSLRHQSSGPRGWRAQHSLNRWIAEQNAEGWPQLPAHLRGGSPPRVPFTTLVA